MHFFLLITKAIDADHQRWGLKTKTQKRVNKKHKRAVQYQWISE